MFQRISVWFAVLLGAVCGLAHKMPRIDPLVSIKGGLIRGLNTDQGYSKFLGVPYAIVDKCNPFGHSIPHPGLDGIFEAYQSNECPQVENNVAIGTLDCLTVDIYVPNTANSNNRLPVMAWLHGGAFIVGSASAHGTPEFLLKHDVIVVAINYRLGAYGFMCLDIPQVPGNQGLKDQVLALRWIKENIEAFGGDATKVTLFGESSGALSVNLHLLSPHEALFQRAIMQSGNALTTWLQSKSKTTVALQLAQALDFETEDTVEALKFLATVDIHTLTKKAHDLKLTVSSKGNSPATLPCIEKNFEGVDHIITEHPLNIASKKIKNIPVIMGNNNNEMHFAFGNQNADFFAAYNFSIVTKQFEFDEDLDEAIDYVRHFYIGDEEPSIDLRNEITDFGSDFMYHHPMQRMAERFLDIGAKAIYRYIFSYDGGRNLYKIIMNLSNTPGAVHADEIGYIFDNDYLSNDITEEDQLIIDRMSTLWTNFAMYGDPTPSTSQLLPVKWEPVTKTTSRYFNLDSEITFKGRPFHDRMAFWDIYYKVYREKLWYINGDN